MKYSPSTVTVERIGAFVQIMVGKSTVRMTTSEAADVVQAIERAIEKAPQPRVAVH